MAAEESITMAELNRYEVIKSLLDGRLMNKEAGRSLQLQYVKFSGSRMAT